MNTIDQEDIILKLHGKLTYEEIAKCVGVQYHRVRDFFNKKGMLGTKWAPRKLELLFNLSQFYAKSDLALIFGCSVSVITYQLKMAGISTPNYSYPTIHRGKRIKLTNKILKIINRCIKFMGSEYALADKVKMSRNSLNRVSNGHSISIMDYNYDKIMDFYLKNVIAVKPKKKKQ